MFTGKPDWLDRLSQIIVLVIGLYSLLFGLFMLAKPLDWYVSIPTLITTGPPNQHFIRDIGIAFVASGMMMIYASPNLAMRWLAAFAGALWPTLHGILHVYEVMAGICGPETFWIDAPGVLGPPLVVLIAIGIRLGRARVSPAGLPKKLFVKAFKGASSEDTAYMDDIAAGHGFATEKFQHFLPITNHRHDAPADLFQMARIGATLVADCGPCAIVSAEMAMGDGVPRDLVNAALSGKPPAGDMALAFAFGQAIAGHQADAGPLGDEIEAKFGRNVRLELTLTAATVTAFPAIKRGLGQNLSCMAVALKV